MRTLLDAFDARDFPGHPEKGEQDAQDQCHQCKPRPPPATPAVHFLCERFVFFRHRSSRWAGGLAFSSMKWIKELTLRRAGNNSWVKPETSGAGTEKLEFCAARTSGIEEPFWLRLAGLGNTRRSNMDELSCILPIETILEASAWRDPI